MASDRSLQDWRALAERLDIRSQAFIDGRYVDAASGATFDSVNPANGGVLTAVAATDAEDVDRAVAAARTRLRHRALGADAAARPQDGDAALRGKNRTTCG